MSGKYRRPPLPDLGEEEYQRREQRLRPGARQRLQAGVAQDLAEREAELAELKRSYREATPGPERAAALRSIALWHRRWARWLDRFAASEHHLRGFFGLEVVDGYAGLSTEAREAGRLAEEEERRIATRPFGGRY